MCPCECIEVTDCGEGPTVFVSKYRVARKSHKCHECGRSIVTGEKYLYESGIWEGVPKGFKTCVDCESLRQVFFCDWGYGIVLEMLKDWLYEGDGAFWEGCVASLTPAARDWFLETAQSAMEKASSG